jgi:hypothetical protein
MAIYNNPAIGVVPAAGFPSFIVAGETWSSGPIANDGYGAIVAALLATQIVTIKIQRYMDANSAVPLTSNSAATTANVAGNCVLSDACPAFYFVVTVANATAVTAVTSNWGIGIGGM